MGVEKAILRDKFYSIPELKQRGWTSLAVTRFLPTEPDDTRANPRYRHAGAPMKLWLKTRVHRVEKTKQFIAWKEASATRRDSAAKSVQTRADNMLEAVERAQLKIKPGYSTEQIRARAEETHGGNYPGDPGPFRWCNRTARNCIRHTLTNYEQLWPKLNRGETGRRAYDRLRERVDALVDETYPQFAGPDDALPDGE